MYTPFDDNDSGKLAKTEVVRTMSIRTTHPCHDMPVLNLCSDMTLQKKKHMEKGFCRSWQIQSDDASD